MNRQRDQQKYIAYLHGQVRELLTNYGPIDVLFFDFTYPSRPARQEGDKGFIGKGPADWDAPGLVKLVRKLQPHIVLNDRLGLWNPQDDWDYKTPEQFVPKEGVSVNGQPVVWEACHTLSGSWGYHRDEPTWKSHAQLVQILVDGVAKGGNLLMNVGPTARGTFDERALDALAAYGRWMKLNARSIYGCGPAPAEFAVPDGCRLTYCAATRRLYLHVFNWPFEQLHLEGWGGKIAYAQLLHDASEVGMKEHQPTAVGDHDTLSEPHVGGTLTLRLPVQKPEVTVPVIELFRK
jgi:alpha-L-fucosidase